jgi:tetratricopeptide (TPR) repeat protein
MKRATRLRAGHGPPAGWTSQHRSAICRLAAAFSVAGAVLWSGVARAEGRADSTPETAQATDPRQLCLGPASTPDERVKGCSDVIESPQVRGSLLAAAYAQRGFVFTLKRNLEQAQKDLDQAIKIAPDYAEAYVNRANFWTVSNQPERAIADAARALKLAPKAPLAYFVRAGGEAKLGQYDKAIADYNEVLRLNPNAGASVYGPRGHAYYRKRDYDRAIADYNELIKLNADDVGAYLNRGDALRSKGELARAGEDYGQAIRLAPDNPGGYSGRGQIRLFTHDSPAPLQISTPPSASTRTTSTVTSIAAPPCRCSGRISARCRISIRSSRSSQAIRWHMSSAAKSCRRSATMPARKPRSMWL